MVPSVTQPLKPGANDQWHLTMSKFTPKGAIEWGSALPTWFGMAGLIACFALWALTDRVEPLFVTTFGGLLAVGAGARALDELRRHEPPVEIPAPAEKAER